MGVMAEEGIQSSTDITEDTIREIALPLGFVDIKARAGVTAAKSKDKFLCNTPFDCPPLRFVPFRAEVILR